MGKPHYKPKDTGVHPACWKFYDPFNDRCICRDPQDAQLSCSLEEGPLRGAVPSGTNLPAFLLPGVPAEEIKNVIHYQALSLAGMPSTIRADVCCSSSQSALCARVFLRHLFLQEALTLPGSEASKRNHEPTLTMLGAS